MSLEGEAAMLLAIDNLTKGYDRRARKAVKEGAEVFAEKLEANTPVSNEDKTGKGPLAQHVRSVVFQRNRVIMKRRSAMTTSRVGLRTFPIAVLPNRIRSILLRNLNKKLRVLF